MSSRTPGNACSPSRQCSPTRRNSFVGNPDTETSGSGHIAGAIYVDMISISLRIETVRARLLLITALICKTDSILAVLFLSVKHDQLKPVYRSMHRVQCCEWIKADMRPLRQLTTMTYYPAPQSRKHIYAEHKYRWPCIIRGM